MHQNQGRERFLPHFLDQPLNRARGAHQWLMFYQEKGDPGENKLAMTRMLIHGYCNMDEIQAKRQRQANKMILFGNPNVRSLEP